MEDEKGLPTADNTAYQKGSSKKTSADGVAVLEGSSSRESSSAERVPDVKSMKMRTENINFYYGSHQVLFDVSVPLRSNRVTALIGPSGCGKSTFLRTLNRMNETIPRVRMEGRVYLDGQDVYRDIKDASLLRTRVGMVFQKSNPFPKSIFDNVAYGLRVNGVKDKRIIAEAVESALKEAFLWDEIKDKLGVSAYQLSGGQQQRLCIARALAVRPEVLLMDEPASALDPLSTSKIEDLIGVLRQNFTIVIVTHNMQQAARVSDYTAFFYQGYMVEMDRTKEIFTKPAKKRTEDYITGRFG